MFRKHRVYKGYRAACSITSIKQKNDDIKENDEIISSFFACVIENEDIFGHEKSGLNGTYIFRVGRFFRD